MLLGLLGAVAVAVVSDLSVEVALVGLPSLVAFTAGPAVIWAARRGSDTVFERLAWSYRLQYYGRASLDGAAWAFFLGSICWSVVRNLRPELQPHDDLGHVLLTGLAFLPVSVICFRRWVNAMCDEQGLARIYSGHLVEPGHAAESIVQITGVVFILALSSPEFVASLIFLGSTTFVLWFAHFVGVYVVTATVSWKPPRESSSGGVPA